MEVVRAPAIVIERHYTTAELARLLRFTRRDHARGSDRFAWGATEARALGIPSSGRPFPSQTVPTQEAVESSS